MFRKSPTPVSDGAFRRLAQKVDLELLARVAKSDCLGRVGGFDCSAMDWFLERARELGVQHAPPEPLVKGRHLLALGMTPGPRVGEVLRQVYERQLDGSITTTDEGIALARELCPNQRSDANTIIASMRRGDVTVPGSGFGVPGSGSGFRVLGSGFRVRVRVVRGSAIRVPVRRSLPRCCSSARRDARPRRTFRSKTSRSAGSSPTCAAHFRNSNRIPDIASGINVRSTNLPDARPRLCRRRALVPARIGPDHVRSRRGNDGGGDATGRCPPRKTAARRARTVHTRMSSVTPQISFNFGKRAGVELHQRRDRRTAFTAERTDAPLPPQSGRSQTFNYGGGARWFSKKHIAVHRSISVSTPISPQEKTATRPALSRMTLTALQCRSGVQITSADSSQLSALSFSSRHRTFELRC